ncbi:MAG TPA: aspartyl protease family protein [Pyrinomonadaceae bacterium]|nr:aspartyl protease family protein [Pyrinomonadaceae bacterium]
MSILKTAMFSILVLLACAVSISAQNLTTVPIQFRGVAPVIEIKINGQGPFIFAIDTGGGMQADVDISLAEKLKLPKNGKVRGGDPSGRNVREFETVNIDLITLGDVEFHNTTAVMRERLLTPNYPKVDGVLGFALFTDYLLTLDYPGKQVRLARGELPAANGADILTFESPRRIPVVDLNIGTMKVRAHVDAGNMVGSFMIPAELVEKLTLSSPPITVGQARTVNNEVEIKEARLNDTIKLGKFSYEQPTITFPAIANEANIGFKVLREFALTFDQKNKRMKLERSAPAKVAPLAISEAEGQDYQGSYGERTITFEGGALYIQRPQGQKLKLVRVSRDEFTLQAVPQAQIKFVRDEKGKPKEIHVLNQAGKWEVSTRQ